MARRVADVRTGLHVLQGPDRRDPRSLPVTLVDASPAERLTIAVMLAIFADSPGLAAAEP